MSSPGPKGSRSGNHPGRRIVVVGQCASGKSTLVQALRDRGIDAYVSAQEHSEIALLWAHQHPDVVIALSVSAQGVRERRTPSWPDWLHHTQTRRLQTAFAAANLIVDTDPLDQEGVLESVLTFLRAELNTRKRSPNS